MTHRHQKRSAAVKITSIAALCRNERAPSGPAADPHKPLTVNEFPI
jgi:hypothetical protein